MKSITFRVVYQIADGTPIYPDKITMTARTINSGFVKAAQYAVKGLPKGWEIVSLTFWDAS